MRVTKRSNTSTMAVYVHDMAKTGFGIGTNELYDRYATTEWLRLRN
jgi:hypothetical protein